MSNISLTDLQQQFANLGLMGKLLNNCADLEISAPEDTAIIKKVLGEDTLRAEQKNPNPLNELLQEIDYFLWLSVQAFLVEACVLDEGSRSERTELYSRYEKYCEDTDRQSLTKNNFYKSLRVKGYQDFKTGGYRYFKGISDEKNSPTPAPLKALYLLHLGQKGSLYGYILEIL